MNDETNKLIEEQTKTLPPQLVEAINEVPWKSLVQEVGKANALDAEQIASLEQETMLILYGFENPNDYVPNIMREIGLAEDVAYKISESVWNKIMDPVSQKVAGNTEVKSVPTSMPEIAPEIHPMIEEGEKAHEIKLEQPKKEEVPISPQPTPSPPVVNRYQGGVDPYREPLK